MLNESSAIKSNEGGGDYEIGLHWLQIINKKKIEKRTEKKL
jgi:hypothetical protein